MKLIVPHTGETHPSDARLIRLAQLMGICCEPLLLERQGQQFETYLERALPRADCCFVFNPQVIREWVGSDFVPTELVSCLVSRCGHVLVHGLTLHPYVTGMIASLSGGALPSVHHVVDASQPYQVSTDFKDTCGPFSGLSFAPVNISNDRVFAVNANDKTIRKLVCIGGRPLMAALNHGLAEIFFLGSEDLEDVHAPVSRLSLAGNFSRLMPHAMALRHIFREECWHPGPAHASLVIDDPLLRSRYGYLHFEDLLNLMKVHNFHTTIAFIPHNYRRNSTQVLKMFREHPDHFSICFHGNDHTQSEFASCNTGFLNTSLGIAEQRMARHEQSTGLHCHKVMVFPQGDFSVEAMEVLRSHNFCAAVNVNAISHPTESSAALTLAEFAEPAVLRYAGFPLFLRKSLHYITAEDIAFHVFFGKPVLLSGHHNVFRTPEILAEVISTVNSVSPTIRWVNLHDAVTNTILMRKTAEGVNHIRAYANTVNIANKCDSLQRFTVKWHRPGQRLLVNGLLQDGSPYNSYAADDSGIGVSAELIPGESRVFAILYSNRYSNLAGPRFGRRATAFIRRRLSEVRDNYLSTTRHGPTIVKALQGLQETFQGSRDAKSVKHNIPYKWWAH